MSEKHTPGRIRYDYEPGYCGELLAENGTSICAFDTEPTKANARRLAACWNACEGLHTESLERNEPLGEQIVDALNQRDELLEALRLIASTKPMNGMNPDARMSDPAHIKVGWNVHWIARAAIGKAEGGVA
jgi:hypothetical protein